jgi:hypothetical protein
VDKNIFLTYDTRAFYFFFIIVYFTRFCWYRGYSMFHELRCTIGLVHNLQSTKLELVVNPKPL